MDHSSELKPVDDALRDFRAKAKLRAPGPEFKEIIEARLAARKSGIDAGMITGPQLRGLLGVTDMTIWRWRRKPEFPKPLKINGRLYYRRTEIAAWLDAQEVAA